MNIDDMNEHNVAAFVFQSRDQYAEVTRETLPAKIMPTSMSYLGIAVRISSAVPDNKIAVMDHQNRLVGWIDINPQPPEIA